MYIWKVTDKTKPWDIELGDSTRFETNEYNGSTKEYETIKAHTAEVYRSHPTVNSQMEYTSCQQVIYKKPDSNDS